ncbi:MULTISPECIES: hypothetical protein [Streptomyces]|uniref:hypothetical protein n=1 Tax=Streptomyces TaxID=1883 RepID=UPI001F0BE54D|nr:MULTISPECIES: hypothetical protein [Streptomyces]
MAFSALLILTVAATRVIHRLNAQHAERIALHSYGGPSTESYSSPSTEQKHPGQAVGRPRPGLVTQPTTVRPRRDDRDGGRGRLRPRRRNARR